jgi:hypothetical protein
MWTAILPDPRFLPTMRPADVSKVTVEFTPGLVQVYVANKVASPHPPRGPDAATNLSP